MHPSSTVINNDCYIVDHDASSAVLDLEAFVLDDVMMTDETQVIDDQLLM